MANEISLVTASGRTVTPKDDGIIYEVFSPGNGIIYGGAVTIKDSSTLHITAGHGIVCGRKFTIDDSDIPVALSGSGSLLGRLYIHLDLADAADPITLLVETGESLTPVVQDSDVNINNGVYEINVATFDVDTSTISNLVDVAPYLNTNGYEHEQINNKLGNTDISGIGDGSVTGAISKLNADINKGYVEVVGDGSATYASKIGNLYSLVDLTKLTQNSVLVFERNSISVTIFLQLIQKGASYLAYSNSSAATTKTYITQILVQTSGVYRSAENNVVTDNSSQVMPNGDKLRLYY